MTKSNIDMTEIDNSQLATIEGGMVLEAIAAAIALAYVAYDIYEGYQNAAAGGMCIE